LIAKRSGYPVPMNLLKEFTAFLIQRKKFWLWPIFVFSLLISALIVFSQGSAVAPFIYAIF
jgi:hypothetical protein